MASPSWADRVARLVPRIQRKAHFIAPRVGQEGEDLSQESLAILLTASEFGRTSRGEYLRALTDGELAGWAIWQAACALRVRACYDLDDATPAPAADTDTSLDVRAALSRLDDEALGVALRLAAGEAASEGATIAEQKRASRARARVRAALAVAV